MCFSMPTAMSSMVTAGRAALSAADEVQKGTTTAEPISQAKTKARRAVIEYSQRIETFLSPCYGFRGGALVVGCSFWGCSLPGCSPVFLHAESARAETKQIDSSHDNFP